MINQSISYFANKKDHLNHNGKSKSTLFYICHFVCFPPRKSNKKSFFYTSEMTKSLKNKTKNFECHFRKSNIITMSKVVTNDQVLLKKPKFENMN